MSLTQTPESGGGPRTPTPRAGPQPGIGIRWLALAFLAITVLVLALVAAPLFTLRPFHSQSAAGLERAYAMRRLAPPATLVALLLAAVLAWRLWRATRWLGRLALASSLLLIAGAVWFSRQNPFEWMFRPLRHPGYVRAAAGSFVEPADMVLAVQLQGDAVAYPVRQVAYHHIVQDEVGGTPVAVTY